MYNVQANGIQINQYCMTKENCCLGIFVGAVLSAASCYRLCVFSMPINNIGALCVLKTVSYQMYAFTKRVAIEKENRLPQVHIT